jgi:protein-S-isoprenylcysteine O-methyltransferase Ste14
VSALAAKATIGALQSLAILALLLFLPARTLDYPQAWIYLVIFASATAFITVYLARKDPALLTRRLKAGPIAETRPFQKFVQIIAACAFMAIFLVAALDHRSGWSLVPVFAQVLGGVLMVLGFLVVFVAFRDNTFASGTIGTWENQQVVSSGIYAGIRHPVYAGGLLMLCGTPLELGSFWALVPVAAVALLIVLRLLDEERFLKTDLSGYTEYCARVRSRLIPYVW